MSIRFTAGYAARSLVRGGQRSVLALVCVSFGVLALVAMQVLAHVVGEATNVPARHRLGGDLLVTAEAGQEESARQRVDALIAERAVDGATWMVAGVGGAVRSTGSGRVRFTGRALGVDPGTWPLVGAVRLEGGRSLASALAVPGHVVLTRDLARDLDVTVGDTIRYGGVAVEPARLVVGGVALTIPDRRGQSLLYSLETARLLAGDRPVIVSAALVAGRDSAAAAGLESAGFAVERAVDVRPDTMGRVFSTALRGAGLLGLIIGGVGIAYTLQVMLTRRRTEIATLRAIGYRTRQLLLLFGIEAAVLGALGGVLGAVLAVAVSAQLVHMLDQTAGALMVEYAVPYDAVLLGPLVGAATAVLFGLAAIVRASAVRPAVLLRDLPVRPGRGARAGSGLLHVTLAGTFVVLAGAVMGSLTAGAAVVAVACVGIVLVGGVLLGLLRIVVRLPMPHLPLLRMARANLRNRQLRSAFSLIALFVGVFTIGFAAAALTTGRERVASKRGSDAGFNIRVFAPADESAAADAALREAGADHVVPIRTARVRTRNAAGRSFTVLSDVEVFERRDLAAVVTITDSAAADASMPGVYVPAAMKGEPYSLQPGDSLFLTVAGAAADGRVESTHVVRIGGFYEPVDSEFFSAPRGLVAGPDVARVLGGPELPNVFLAAVPERLLDEAAPHVGERLRGSLVMSRRDLNEFLVATYQSLFMFVVAVAGLSLLAGVVLIANAVSLAMVERRRELGVLMAVGYTGRRVLRTIMLENGVLGLIAGAAGIVAVRVVIAIMNAREASLRLEFGSVAAVTLVATAIVLAMTAAAAVAWGPVHVRPLEVLRDE